MEKWIDIKKQIPSSDERVIACILKDYSDEDQRQFAIFAGSDKLNRFVIGNVILDDEVTHWMKQPKLPEEIS